MKLTARRRKRRDRDGNRELIGQALSNLIDNAIKYRPRSPGAQPLDAEVAAWRSRARRGATGEIVLSVTDNGPGIPEGGPPARHQALRAARGKPLKPGTGLGLSLVQAVVNPARRSSRSATKPDPSLTAYCFDDPRPRGEMSMRQSRRASSKAALAGGS